VVGMCVIKKCVCVCVFVILRENNCAPVEFCWHPMGKISNFMRKSHFMRYERYERYFFDFLSVLEFNYFHKTYMFINNFHKLKPI